MQQLQFKVSKLIADLSDKLTNHKLIFSKSIKNTQFDIQFIRLENGLYFLSGKVKSDEAIEFVQMAEIMNDWTIIHYSMNDINSAKQKQPAGIYTGFNDIGHKVILDANTELNLYIIIAHREYLKTYNFLTVFDAIYKKKNELYYQAFSDEIVCALFFVEKKMGLIKIKQHIFELITLFCFKEQKMNEKLKTEIDGICQMCLEQRMDVSIYLADKYRFEPWSIDDYFYTIFGTDIDSYYQNFKLYAVKKFLQEKDNLNLLLLANIESHTPCVKQIIEKFDLKEVFFKRLFFEEFGESIYDYYRKFRLEIAKNYLFDKIMKVYQVAESLGYKKPSKFIRFIQKNEGHTPRQLLIRQNVKNTATECLSNVSKTPN